MTPEMDDAHLTRAFELAMMAREAGDHPFGALLALDREVLVEGVNRVNTDRDLTAHAETMLIRLAESGGFLAHLPRGTVYASCEPCPMCVGAMFWAGARRVVYGLSSVRLMTFMRTTSDEPYGFTVTPHAITSNPPVLYVGPQREDEAAVAHQGFWTT